MGKIARRVGIVLGVLIVARVLIGLFVPALNINDVTTGATPEYPDLQPQRFTQPAAQVFDAASAVAHASEGWEVTQEDRANSVIQAVATTKLMHFKDDVTITVATAGDGTTVNVRSHSRVGKGDLGANAKRIRAFQAELAKRVSASRP
jgi:uncharacterized protein (DUF1499 family)